MKPTGALFASAAIAVLTIAGGILFTHAADSSSAPVAWAEEAGSGTIFPACGSAQASATCVNSTGTASLTWDFSLGGSGPSTLVTFTSPSGAQLVKQTFSGVVGSVSVPKLGPGTHTLSAVPTYGAGADPSGGATNSISVPNCLSCTTNTGCSGNDLYYLDTSGGFCNFIASCSYQCSAGACVDAPASGTTCPNEEVAPNGDASQCTCEQGNTSLCGRCADGTLAPGNNTASCPVTGTTGSASHVCSTNGDGVTLSWPAVTGATNYQISLWTNDGYCPNSYWSKSLSNGAWDGHSCYVYNSATSAFFPTIPGNSYAASIFSGNSAGFNWSSPATTGTFVCTAPPPPPVASISKTCSTDGKGAALSWTSSIGATSYRLGLWTNDGYCPSYWYKTLSSNGAWDGHSCYADNESTYAFFPTVPGRDYTVWVYPGNTNGFNWSNPATTGTFSCKEPVKKLPDLSAWEDTNISSASLTPTDSITLYGWVPNYGAAAVPAVSFPNLFQVSIGGQPAFINQVVNSSGPIAADTSGGTSPSYNAVSASIGTLAANTYAYRICADNNASFVGSIDEGSNEGNNCGAWVPFTVGTPPTLPDLSAWEDTNISSASLTPTDSITLYGWVPNYGAAAVPAVSFPNLFQVARYGESTSFINKLVASNGPIPADTSGGTSPSYNAVNASIGPLPAGTYGWRLCADNNASFVGSIDEGSNEGNNCGPWISFTVSSEALPDLSAWEDTNISSASLTPTDSITLYGWVPNYGAAAVPAVSFPNLFQVSIGGQPAFINQVVNSSGPIAADTSGGTSPSYNAVSASIGTLAANTYAYRICADNNASWVGSITESSETNNCGPWVPFTVADSSESTSLSCTRSPADATMPAPATITYTAVPSGGATSPYVFRNALGVVLQSGTGLTYQRTYTVAGNYAVTVSASGVTGEYACGTAVAVTDGSSCGALSNSITANPTRLPAPGTTHVSWSATGVEDSCIITEDGATIKTATPPGSSCSLNCSGQQCEINPDPTITKQTTYCITCDGKTALKKCVTVNVGGNFQEF